MGPNRSRSAEAGTSDVVYPLRIDAEAQRSPLEEPSSYPQSLAAEFQHDLTKRFCVSNVERILFRKIGWAWESGQLNSLQPAPLFL